MSVGEMAKPPPGPAAVRAAAGRVAGVAVRTPIVESAWLNAQSGRRVVLKAENLQHCAAYKFRGAYNRLSQLTDAERARGVVAWSSGNHAVAVATAARLIGVSATVVIPKDAPRAKVERVVAANAKVVEYDRRTEDREQIAREICRRSGAILVPSFDDPDIIAGQGTAALELIEQSRHAGATIKHLIVPCGGGGLAAGAILACELVSPEVRVIVVEPEGFADTALSLASGRRISISISERQSICDALLAAAPGAVTFPILRAGRATAISCTEAEVRRAVRFAFEQLKLVLEPSGAIGLAAVLRAGLELAGDVGVILTGGSVDRELFCACLQ